MHTATHHQPFRSATMNRAPREHFAARPDRFQSGRTGSTLILALIASVLFGMTATLRAAAPVLLDWGATNDTVGILGTGTVGGSPLPVAVDYSGVLAGKTVTAVSAGNNFCLALDSAGKIYSWGYNSGGQLGNTSIATGTGAGDFSASPVAVDMTGALSGKTVTAIAAGIQLATALTSDGKVYTWGTSYLGDGTSNSSPVPVAVDTSGVLSGKTVTAIAAGGNFDLVLTSDGKLFSWGNNDSGQLGNNAGGLLNGQSLVPVAVDTSGVLAGKTIVAIAAGSSQAMALTSDNKIIAWGGPIYALGAGNGVTDLGNGGANPVAVDMTGVLNGRTIVQIACFNSFSAALASDGTVYTWGYSNGGDLGNGTSGVLQYTPVAVDTTGALSGKTVTKISGGGSYVVALASDGKLYSWGDNTQGQLGGTPAGGAAFSKVPIAVNTSGLLGGYGVTDLQIGSGGGNARISIVLATASTQTAPIITTQPVNQTVTAGSSASFSVTASGNPAPTYQWQKGGVNISGATSATYTIASVVAGDAGSYTAVATNSVSAATSSPATLTVNVPATITTQPVSVTVTAGSSVSFSITASGNPAPTYQWQKGGVNIAGATSATYTIASVVAGDAGSYTAVATNSVGTVTSSAATLTVSAALTTPLITTQPASQTVTAGSSVSFSITASGNPAPTYQWQKGGVNIAGATSATYTIASVVAGDAGSYTAVATNSVGAATSSAATLTVSAASTTPVFTTQPASQTVTTGNSASFTAAASGNPAPTYQWYFGGAVISGATSATLSLSNVQAATAGSYYVTATNSSGSAISTTATLTVQASGPLTLIASQPVTVGHDAAISATGAGGTTQWQVSTDSGATWQSLSDGTSYSGTASSTLEILKASTTLNGYLYHCVVAGTASSATKLVVMPVFFPFPTGVGPDSSGNLYVSDATAQTIQKVNATDQVTLVAGSTGASGGANGTGSAARFNQPGALAVAADGSLNVSDTANDLIRSITSAGAVMTLAGTAGSAGTADGTGAAAKFSLPVGVARDASGVLFVADSHNQTIRKITAAGVVTTFAGSAGNAGSVDNTGTSARFNNPAGIAIDSAGNVYVADAANDTIRKITASGVVTTLAGSPGVSGSQDGTGNGAQFSNPGGLAISAAGDLYLADTGNSTIRKITTAGVVTTVAGLAGTPGLMDGSGGYAWFDQPEGLTIGPDGNLYVADTGNAVIRKITLAGDASTLVLTAGPTPPPPPPPPSPAPQSGGGGAIGPWFALILFGLGWSRSRKTMR